MAPKRGQNPKGATPNYSERDTYATCDPPQPHRSNGTSTGTTTTGSTTGASSPHDGIDGTIELLSSITVEDTPSKQVQGFGCTKDNGLSSESGKRASLRLTGVPLETLFGLANASTTGQTAEDLHKAIHDFHAKSCGRDTYRQGERKNKGKGTSKRTAALPIIGTPSPAKKLCRDQLPARVGTTSSDLTSLQDAEHAEDLNQMATRNKPRPGYVVKDDSGSATEEEHLLWNQIQADLRKCAAVQEKQLRATKRIREIHEQMNETPNKVPAKLYEEMDSLSREVLKLTQEEQCLLNEEPADIIKSLGILKALREASCGPAIGRAASPAARVTKDKHRKKTGSGSGKFDGMDLDSPGPSPVAAGRLKSSGRSGSIASGRDAKESSVKADDSAHASEGSKGPSAERAGKFFEGADVAYKQAKPKEDGSQWIQCIIVSITERNGKKRYEVQDPEPDESGAPGDIYTASASALIAIPPAEADLSELPVGKTVLARYPETTTFYRAEVTGHVSSKRLCRLKFEDDQNHETEVPRRFVLSLDK